MTELVACIDWSRRFLRAAWNTGIRGCRERIPIASPTAAPFPLAVQTLRPQGVGLRDRYQQGGDRPRIAGWIGALVIRLYFRVESGQYIDFSLFRNISITERLNGQLRMESFNFTNSPQYDNPNTTFGDPNFGQVATAGDDYNTGRGDPDSSRLGCGCSFQKLHANFRSSC